MEWEKSCGSSVLSQSCADVTEYDHFPDIIVTIEVRCSQFPEIPVQAETKMSTLSSLQSQI